MTRAQAEAHQAKHGFLVTKSVVIAINEKAFALKDRMNKTEREYSLILEAMKRRGDIIEWRFEGISLSWGLDPKTQKPMWYTPDFTVFRNEWCDEPAEGGYPIAIIEVKGPHIYEKDLIRFKGCRADWPQFQFEMHQKKGGEWLRLH
jgi:hypothetical protein